MPDQVRHDVRESLLVKKLALTLALSAIAAVPATAGRRDIIRELAGAYHEPGSWAQIIPVDSHHAYVHFYFLGGLSHDLISEFEAVMTVDGSTLTYRKEATEDGPGCRLTLRRKGRLLEWSAPEEAPCAANANWNYPRIFLHGSISLGSRKPINCTRRLLREGYGTYEATVEAWRAGKPE